jgi:hypothetical protein
VTLPISTVIVDDDEPYGGGVGNVNETPDQFLRLCGIFADFTPTLEEGVDRLDIIV